jgi:signal transduction histidine kinase
LVDTDLAAAKALLEEMGRDVQQAMDDTAQLAQQIYPPLLEAGGLAAALRAAAMSVGIPVSIEVEAAAGCPPDVVRTVYSCCLEALEHAGADTPATITVRQQDATLAFDVVAAGAGSDAELDRLCDRVEALGGQLTVRSEPHRVTRISGSLPFSR